METLATPPDPPLGPRIELFRAPRAQVYVGFVLGALITAGGLGIAGCGVGQIPEIASAPTQETKKKAIGSLVGGLIVGGLIAFFGVLGIWVARSLVGTGVEVCENGLRQWPPGPDSAAVLWGDIERIEELYIYERVPLKLGGPLMSETLRVFVVVLRDGRRFPFDRGTIAAVGRLGKRLRAIATAHSIPWVVEGQPD